MLKVTLSQRLTQCVCYVMQPNRDDRGCHPDNLQRCCCRFLLVSGPTDRPFETEPAVGDV